MILDKDGMERYDMEWTIEGQCDGQPHIRSGKLYEMHAAELENAKRNIRRLAYRGDTVTMKVI